MAKVQSAPINMPQFNWMPKSLSGDTSPLYWPPVFFPLNPSLEDEFNRLFSDFRDSLVPKKVKDNDIWNEFRHNGRDFEYCPDPDDVIVPTPSKKKNKKPLATECVFCKNNGEDVRIYKKHLLKDLDGRTVCPILRRYTCPICNVSGDGAHTIKYCPMNNTQNGQAPMNVIKGLRNSTGRRRSK